VKAARQPRDGRLFRRKSNPRLLAGFSISHESRSLAKSTLMKSSSVVGQCVFVQEPKEESEVDSPRAAAVVGDRDARTTAAR
jgi:hypothetical protein